MNPVARVRYAVAFVYQTPAIRYSYNTIRLNKLSLDVYSIPPKFFLDTCAGRWFIPSNIAVSSVNLADRQDKTEIF